MSELKAYHCNEWHNEYTEFYIKSEADKVIAELKADYKEACDRLQTANLIKDEQLAATRHNKYKRCLAMAELCDSEGFWYENQGEDIIKARWFFKWRRKWYRLYEQFKEAK